MHLRSSQTSLGIPDEEFEDSISLATALRFVGASDRVKYKPREERGAKLISGWQRKRGGPIYRIGCSNPRVQKAQGRKGGRRENVECRPE